MTVNSSNSSHTARVLGPLAQSAERGADNAKVVSSTLTRTKRNFFHAQNSFKFAFILFFFFNFNYFYLFISPSTKMTFFLFSFFFFLQT